MLSQSVSDSISFADDPLAGQPYRAIRLLGSGGMGEVFLAEHRRFATPCVVKIQHARLGRDPSVADRIRLEAESLARLDHANIVSILGTGQTFDERPYIVMEYLRGQTMADEFAARGQLPPLEALSYICQLLRGLAAAHAIGIVHRDVKPDNLFLCDGPRGNRLLKVLDFGVAYTTPDARGMGPNPLAVPTATGTVVGALRYVSPEGALARRVDHRADLYSAALVLYFAIAGRGPFDHIQSALLLLSAHAAEEPEPPSRFAKAHIPAELDQAILKALRKAPSDRFQSADELREELERIMDLMRTAADASAVRPLPEGAQRGADASGSRIRSVQRVDPDASSSDQSGPLRVGSRFLDKYQIREQIGRGGQAWVYHGEHIFTGREVAIKIVHSPRGMTYEMLERGKSEARALGKLDHPNIVVMHDAGVTEDGLFYIVMELLRGRSLRSALSAHGHFAIEEVLNLAISVAEAVHAAHEIGLVHRDLTPDNVYLTRNNRVKVLDFGIAKMLNEIGFSTNKDIVMGSILYMSPEQVQGCSLTPRSDICALGLMMFEMLLGKHPSLLLFEQDLQARNEPHRRAALADIPPIQAHRTPPLLSDLEPNIPEDLAQVVARAIAKNPDDRFATMREFVSALRACQEGYTGEGPVTLRRGNDRDLSQHLDGESKEPPSSQRATPRRGLIWDGAISLTPVPLHEDLAITNSISGSLTARDGEFVTRRSARRSRSITWLRVAAIIACVFGAALCSAGVLWYFGVSRVPAQPDAESGAETPAAPASDPMLASLTPVPAAEGASEPSPPPDSQPSLASEVTGSVVTEPPRVPVARNPTPAARPMRAPVSTTATVSVKANNSITDVSRALELEPSNRRSSDATSSEPRKKLNGGKLIYGD
ncbi:MAG TPA: serine/threonine-protein kinase [Polyangiaceae bacterium]|nr:serine/threonine-protein kinase [Polyangiaceae bacterium]